MSCKPRLRGVLCKVVGMPKSGSKVLLKVLKHYSTGPEMCQPLCKGHELQRGCVLMTFDAAVCFRAVHTPMEARCPVVSSSVPCRPPCPLPFVCGCLVLSCPMQCCLVLRGAGIAGTHRCLHALCLDLCKHAFLFCPVVSGPSLSCPVPSAFFVLSSPVGFLCPVLPSPVGLCLSCPIQSRRLCFVLSRPVFSFLCTAGISGQRCWSMSPLALSCCPRLALICLLLSSMAMSARLLLGADGHSCGDLGGDAHSWKGVAVFAADALPVLAECG